MKFFTNMMFPPGLPKPIYVLLAPIELLSNVIIRPFTMAIRLFANMFAGHLLLTIFTVATFYLASFSFIGIVGSATSFLMTTILTAFQIADHHVAGPHLHATDGGLHRRFAPLGH